MVDWLCVERACVVRCVVAAADQKEDDRCFRSVQQILHQRAERINPEPHVCAVGHLVWPPRQYRLQLMWGTGSFVGLPTVDDLRLIEPPQHIIR